MGRIDEGREGTAAEVVDEDRGALRVQGTRVAVRVLEARSGGFVDHREDVPACTAERLEGQEALRRPGMRGNADESLKLSEAGTEATDEFVRTVRATYVRKPVSASSTEMLWLPRRSVDVSVTDGSDSRR